MPVGLPKHSLLRCFTLHAGVSDLRLYDSSDLKTYLYMSGLGPVVVSVAGVQLLDFYYSGIHILLSPHLCFISFFIP